MGLQHIRKTHSKDVQNEHVKDELGNGKANTTDTGKPTDTTDEKVVHGKDRGKGRWYLWGRNGSISSNAYDPQDKHENMDMASGPPPITNGTVGDKIRRLYKRPDMPSPSDSEEERFLLDLVGAR